MTASLAGLGALGSFPLDPRCACAVEHHAPHQGIGLDSQVRAALDRVQEGPGRGEEKLLGEPVAAQVNGNAITRRRM